MYSLLEKTVAVFAVVASVKAQSAQQLQGAIESYPELSTFSDFLKSAPDALDNVFSNDKITVLIPDNDAIAEYLKTTKTSDLSKVDPGALKNFLEYHVMATALKGSDFTGETGMVVPTELKEEKFNNRTAGVAIQQRYGDNATGQVIFAAPEQKSTQSTGGATTVDLRGGLAQDSKMKAVDGTWGASNSSYFQIVDKVLVPPRNCSTTVRTAGDDRLDGLDKALINAKLWPALDTSKNVTCLAPSTQAFKDAGNPEDTLSQLELSQALLAHTLNEVTYTNYLEDGQSIGTLNGTSVTVKIDGDDIYFNNAKVIEANVLTNNGLIHILDALIQPDGTPTSSGNGTSTGSPSSASNTGSPTPTNAGSLLNVNLLGLVAVVISLIV